MRRFVAVIIFELLHSDIFPRLSETNLVVAAYAF